MRREGDPPLQQDLRPGLATPALPLGEAQIAHRRVILETARKTGRARTVESPKANEIQDSLYGPDGLPD